MSGALPKLEFRQVREIGAMQSVKGLKSGLKLISECLRHGRRSTVITTINHPPFKMSKPVIKIVLADNDAAMQRLLEEYLVRLGYEVLAAQTGIDAIHKTRDFKAVSRV